MASIQRRLMKDNRPSFRVQFRIDGHSTSESFDTYDEAERFGDLVDRLGGAAARRKLERSNGSLTADGPTLNNVLEDYIKRARHTTEGTRDDYRRIFTRSGIADHMGDMPVRSIVDDDVQEWLDYRTTTPSDLTGDVVSPKTLRNEHGLLSTVLAHAVERGWADSNEAKGARLPAKVKPDMFVMTDDQYRAIHDAMDPDYQPLVEFLAVTGARWGEATALQWRDINAKASPPLVTIRRAWKKGKAGGWHVAGMPKSSAGYRTFTVPARLIQRLGTPGKPDALVFPNKTGGPIAHTNFHARKWRRACDTAGVTDPYPKIHDLRHYCVSTLLSAGVPIHAVSRRIGHTSITTTVNVYGYMTPDMQVAGLDTMEAIISRPALTV